MNVYIVSQIDEYYGDIVKLVFANEQDAIDAIKSYNDGEIYDYQVFKVIDRSISNEDL